ncbi:MAG: TonB-dependent receptor plug domain-containing protein [Gemmatimonadetes bacterium]|jgi:hypothetical protein|nr:TonB-dependent receptor plug domain-containing protein [Gemmatimonadota bacterium]
MIAVRTFVLALTLVMVGCASAPTAESGRSGRDANLLTAEEIERVHYNNVYELVQALRPSWIQGRGRVSIQDPTAGEAVVYVDGMRFGGVGQLRQLRTADVASIQHLSAGDASSRFGLDHAGGAILVHSKRGG